MRVMVIVYEELMKAVEFFLACAGRMKKVFFREFNIL